MATGEPRFFATPAAWRGWLSKHHATARELEVGFRKKATGRASITWAEAVAEALCFGWIDGVRHRIDDESYRIRFTPRRPGSHWSAVNVRQVAALRRAGKMTAAGEKAFAARDAARTALYSYERANASLTPDERRAIRANKAASAFFEDQAPSYRKAATWWVVSAKRPETRASRLATLIRDSAAGRTVAPLTRKPAKK